tara:strand:- start:3052 stop:3438 length:387 start_codon:yes stop_codon:yes gene_type:complete
MLSNKEIITNWKKCGNESLKSFSIDQHYSVFFDDEEDGFDHLFKNIPLDKLSKLKDEYVNIRMNEIDDKMKEVSKLVESFFYNFLTKDNEDEVFGNYQNYLKDKIYRKYNEVIMIRNEIEYYLLKKKK